MANLQRHLRMEQHRYSRYDPSVHILLALCHRSAGLYEMEGGEHLLPRLLSMLMIRRVA